MKLKQRVVGMAAGFLLSLTALAYYFMRLDDVASVHTVNNTNYEDKKQGSELPSLSLKYEGKSLNGAKVLSLKAVWSKEQTCCLDPLLLDLSVGKDDTMAAKILNIVHRNSLFWSFPSVAPLFASDCGDSAPGPQRTHFPALLQYLHPPELQLKKVRVTLQDIHGIQNTDHLSSLEKFHVSISDQDLYSEDDPNVPRLLNDMATKTIVHVEEKSGGTQLKLTLTFEDGSQALFKPMRFDRDRETDPNHFYFVDFERHVSEIATFHLDRLLGFRRCPPVVGRKLNVTTEIYAVADDQLVKTFFVSPAGNVCFHGACSSYCDTGHAICGRPDVLEGSLAAYMPPDGLSGRRSWKHPWRRSYHKRRKADFERNPRHCDAVRARGHTPKRISHLVDAAILDFFIGNMDRHHYETFKVFGNDSFVIHLDHGRGFGRPGHDEFSILAPLYQCCLVSFSTFERLVRWQHGRVRLSSAMRCSLSEDPVSPVLLEKHLRALDRRLEVVLRVIEDCLREHGSGEVFYRDWI